MSASNLLLNCLEFGFLIGVLQQQIASFVFKQTSTSLQVFHLLLEGDRVANSIFAVYFHLNFGQLQILFWTHHVELSYNFYVYMCWSSIYIFTGVNCLVFFIFFLQNVDPRSVTYSIVWSSRILKLPVFKTEVTCSRSESLSQEMRLKSARAPSRSAWTRFKIADCADESFFARGDLITSLLSWASSSLTSPNRISHRSRSCWTTGNKQN